ncbi:MAG: FtsX-like permease family protein, partial [Butyrivibrio sp.]|nr:FtsX-like permease family protein [Butyrivibrio sp.]
MDKKMRSYLSLIPISARVRRKQSKLILVCIILAVFLVTSIFSLAEAGLRTETESSVNQAGFWHIRVSGIDEEDAERIAASPDVAVSSWYDVLNLDEDFHMDKDYYIGGARTALCGIEDSFVGDIMHYFSEGARLENENDVILTENARELLGVSEGDSITLNTPAGDHVFVVSGFRISGDGKYVGSNGGEISALLVRDDQVGAFMDIGTFRRICSENNEAGSPQYYIQFGKRVNLRKAIAKLKAEYGIADSDTALNTILMAVNGIADKKAIQNIYPLVAALFLMILAAGVLMISSSMNSNVAQRMQFFGMLRCIGASKGQIIHFVRLEALNWCRIAIPIGSALGILVSLLLTFCVRNIVGGELSSMPYVVSFGGILCGIVLGVVTVLLAAQVPAKRAAKASPVAAVSGNAEKRHFSKPTCWLWDCVIPQSGIMGGNVETMLGIHHAISAKKNLFLMTGSFALSIILFLCFSVLITVVNCLVPQKASAPDIDITSRDITNSIDASLVDAIGEIEGVAHAHGRSLSTDVPAELKLHSRGEGGAPEILAGTVDLISYDAYQLELLVKDSDLRKGSDISKMDEGGNCALAIWDSDMPLEIGDSVLINGEELEIVGMLKYNPYSNSGGSDGKINLITLEEMFVRLTGITDYVIVEAQFESRSMGKTDAAAEAIRRLAEGYDFRDRREEATGSVFIAFMAFVYGFLAIIAFIALLNIVNSISMSVSSRINQYGAMRAIGMSVGQITKMIAAEAFTYAVFGCIFGCGIGLPLSKWMYDFLVTAHFYYFTWSLPVGQIGVILLFVFAAALVAVYAPSKRIRNMVVTETIN